MRRLTRKDNRTKSGCKLPTYATKNEEDVFIKLFKLENLEEELGIDLLTLFKALKDGIWYKYIDGNLYRIPYACLNLSYSDTYELWVEHHKYLDGLLIHLKDYGKTWALSRNDLEEKDDE